MACSASAFAFFALDGPAAYADLRAAALADYRASAAAASSAAAAAPSAVHPRGAVRRDSGGPADQCSFCVSAAPLEAGREAGGCGACDGCGQPACGACAAARLAACPTCGFAACEDCRLQLGEEEDGTGQDVGGRPDGCWCESGSQRDADNHRFVSRERYKAVSMTHPSMRASSMAAAGLRDDEDDGEADGWAFAHGWQLLGGAADGDAITGDGGSGGSSAGAGYGASASWLGGVLLHGAAGGRHGSMELSSDGGSGLRRSMMRYGALGARSRHSGCF